MKKKNIFDIISNIDPNIITESEGKVRTRPAAHIALAATACALALCIGIGALYPMINKKGGDPSALQLNSSAERSDSFSYVDPAETGIDGTQPTEPTEPTEPEPTEPVIPDLPDSDPKGEIINLSSSLDVQRDEGKAADESFKNAYFDFSVELLKEQLKATEEENKNTLLSPLSAMYAMTMIANGAAGDTLAEMEAALGRGLSIDELNGYLSYLFDDLCTEGSGVTMANSIWFRDIYDLTVSDAYLNKNALYYKAEIFKAPFNDDAKNAINAWASDNTDGMIQNVLNKIPPEARLYIMNALLFEAQWDDIFYDKKEDDTFTDSLGNEHTVTMLSGHSEYRLYDVNADGVIKNYDNGYSFFALLPEEGVTVEEYVDSLTAERLYDVLNNAKKKWTLTQLPEFTTDYNSSLKPALKAMGINKAFTNVEADFTEMATSTLGPIWLDSVDQFTRIELTSEGTKAAAVTSGGMVTVESVDPTPPDILRFDRPFVYGIMKDDGTVLFMGVQNTME